MANKVSSNNVEHILDQLTGSIDHIDTDKSVEFYKNQLEERTKGPQLEGFTEEWLMDTFADQRTKLLDLGDGIVWPILTPVEHNHDYRKDFFEDHFPGQPAYYLSFPPLDLDSEDLEDIQASLQIILDSVTHERGVIAYDFLEEADTLEDDWPKSFLQFAAGANVGLRDVTPDSQGFGMTYGKPEVVHFEAIASQSDKWPLGDCDLDGAFKRLVERGKIGDIAGTGPVVLSSETLSTDKNLLDQIWHMYQSQFDELVEDHPSLQIQPREELEKMLLDEGSFNIAYVERGSIKALCYFVSNIEKCVWLNPKFFSSIETNSQGLRLAYFPGIVVEKESARQGAGYVDEMIGLIEKVYQEAGMQGMQIVFQCTNISKEYIPKIVTQVITNNKVFAFNRPADQTGSSFRETARYSYHVVIPENLS